jgi:co-chaperonin GroES (HSP10)
MTATKEQYVKEHFPEVDCGAVPCGPKVVVQLRTVKEQSAGGIILAQATKEFNNGNTQIARVIKMGAIAFRDRSSGDTWKEGAWAEIGDLVVIPRWGGFRWDVEIPGTKEKAIFAVFDDTNIQMRVESNFEAFDAIL